MPIYEGNIKSGKLEFQNRIIKEGYLGSTLVYQSKKLITIRPFVGAGTHHWMVPAGVTSVDVFLVGGGAGGGCAANNTGRGGGGGGGYTKTFLNVPVTPGSNVQIIIGKGGAGSTSTLPGTNGGFSHFINSTYRAEGGSGGWSEWGSQTASTVYGGSGGSGGGSGQYFSGGFQIGNGGSDGSDGTGTFPGIGQHTTTRDFGEPTGGLNCYGGNGGTGGSLQGYGRGGNGSPGGRVAGGAGQDGTCLIRYWG